ncbi:unnamed protein product [Dovyalis caffra]|uniref:DUF4005 domain-containing protein n=1 Tax=Dovyalis caffra TaxID=77055 RepID=A0AAV1QMX0_9ROSI|nr:unnamed protein product [Dovyalis caffra]
MSIIHDKGLPEEEGCAAMWADGPASLELLPMGETTADPTVGSCTPREALGPIEGTRLGAPKRASRIPAMGKSAGKWIKTVIFRKKSYKSSFSKKAAVKEAIATSRGSTADLASSPVISDPLSHVSDENDTEEAMGLDSPDASEVIRQEQAATKVQTAFRGYLLVLIQAMQFLLVKANANTFAKAHRSFRVLKGIIRLQAVIRGRLVRRQAVTTLHCLQGIVKLQALIRRRSVRVLDNGQETLTKGNPGRFLDAKKVDPFGLYTATRSEKLYTNALICKLLASSSNATPLSLHYDLVEPNSAWNWLERWSSFLFQEPFPQKQQILDSRSNVKQPSIQSIQTEGRKKRGAWRIAPVNADNNSLHSVSEFGKPKHNLRKALSHPTELMQENPSSELERVRKNLRKFSSSSPMALDGLETLTEKPKLSPRKMVRSPARDVFMKVEDSSSKKISDPMVALTKDLEKLEAETSPKPLTAKEMVNLPTAQLYPLESSSVDKIHVADEDMNSKEEECSKDNQRTRRRKSSSAKQEYQEDVSQNTPTVPSYMAATESAKAKLRGQGSPRIVQDGVENVLIRSRRHSHPAYNDGKLSSVSHQTQRIVHANSKGRSRVDRSLLSSTDVNASTYKKVPFMHQQFLKVKFKAAERAMLVQNLPVSSLATQLCVKEEFH